MNIKELDFSPAPIAGVEERRKIRAELEAKLAAASVAVNPPTPNAVAAFGWTNLAVDEIAKVMKLIGGLRNTDEQKNKAGGRLVAHWVMPREGVTVRVMRGSFGASVYDVVVARGAESMTVRPPECQTMAAMSMANAITVRAVISSLGKLLRGYYYAAAPEMTQFDFIGKGGQS